MVWAAQQGGAGDYEIFFWDGSFPIQPIQITDNDVDDRHPDISGSNVVWYGGNGNDREIYFWDGVTTTRITNNTTIDWMPAVSGSNVVWSGSGDGDYEIYMTTVPEPSTALLLATGLAGLAAARRRQQ